MDTRITVNPKVYLRTDAEDGARLRLKVEINTHERAPAQPLIGIPFGVDSSWWSGSAEVSTFTIELIATKIRALYQHKKGRDLFDLWLALTELDLSAEAILAAFGPYRPDGLTARGAISNLNAKVSDPEFCTDLDLLTTTRPTGYDIAEAADLVATHLLARL